MAKAKIEEIHSRLSKKVVHIQEDKFNVNFSYGVINFYNGELFNEVLEEVDLLMYENKESVPIKVRKKDR
jgi:hypothetical protein